jgi:hypothetical protein
MKKLNVNNEITVRFIGDSELRPKAKVIARTETAKSVYVTILFNGELIRKKVNTDNEKEYIYPLGKYSFAPIAY